MAECRNLPGGNCCPHGHVSFLAWHRLYMVQMEGLLGEPLPYWDWSQQDTPPVNFWRAGQVKEGVDPRLRPCPGSTSTTTRQNDNVNAEELQNMVQAALEETNYVEFNNEISNPHNLVHARIGCDMGSIAVAAYDPVFYLHHTFVDYLFAYWQELQTLRGLPHFNQDQPAGGFNVNFEPFATASVNSNQHTRENSQGRDQFDYRRVHCYRYDDLLFRGMTPRQFLDSSADRNSEDRIFAGLTITNSPDTFQEAFDVCRGEECVPGGSFAHFGSVHETFQRQGERNDSLEEHIPVRMEVTDIVKAKGWEPSDPAIRLRISNGTDVYGNTIPLEDTYQPVVIYRPGGQDNPYIVRLHSDMNVGSWKNPYPPNLKMGKPFFAEFIELQNGTKTETPKLDGRIGSPADGSRVQTNLVKETEQHFNIKGIDIALGIIG